MSHNFIATGGKFSDYKVNELHYLFIPDSELTNMTLFLRILTHNPPVHQSSKLRAGIHSYILTLIQSCRHMTRKHALYINTTIPTGKT